MKKNILLKSLCFLVFSFLVSVLFSRCHRLGFDISEIQAQTADSAPSADGATPGGSGEQPGSGGGSSTDDDKKDMSNPCNRLPGDVQETCTQCMGNVNNPDGFWTALGCISTNPVTAVGQLLDFLLGVGGFFVVTQILVGSFEMLTSQGDPGKLQSARERVVNSIVALLFIVFSVTILEFVGVSILHLPGFFDQEEEAQEPVPVQVPSQPSPDKTNPAPGTSQPPPADGVN